MPIDASSWSQISSQDERIFYSEEELKQTRNMTVEVQRSSSEKISELREQSRIRCLAEYGRLSMGVYSTPKALFFSPPTFAVDLPSCGDDDVIKKLVGDGNNRRIRNLPPCRKTRRWHPDAAVHYMWGRQSFKFCKLLGHVATQMPDWNEVLIKLNQLILRRIQMPNKDGLAEEANQIRQTDLENLTKWVGTGNYIKDRDPDEIVLPFKALTKADLPPGVDFDCFGLIAPAKFAKTPPSHQEGTAQLRLPSQNARRSSFQSDSREESGELSETFSAHVSRPSPHRERRDTRRKGSVQMNLEFVSDDETPPPSPASHEEDEMDCEVDHATEPCYCTFDHDFRRNLELGALTDSQLLQGFDYRETEPCSRHMRQFVINATARLRKELGVAPSIDTERETAYLKDVLTSIKQKGRRIQSETKILHLLEQMELADTNKIHLVSRMEAYRLLESTEPLAGPIVTDEQDGLLWDASQARPIEQLFDRYTRLSDTSVACLMTCADPSSSSHSDWSLTKTRNRLLKRTFYKHPVYFPNLPNPYPAAFLPQFLTGPNCQLLHRILDELHLDSSSKDHSCGLDWITIAESGSQTFCPPDFLGHDRWFRVVEGEVGMGYSQETDNDSRSWQFFVLRKGQAAFFEAGTAMVFFRRYGFGQQTMMMAGNVLRWSRIENWFSTVSTLLGSASDTIPCFDRFKLQRYADIITELAKERQDENVDTLKQVFQGVLGEYEARTQARPS